MIILIRIELNENISKLDGMEAANEIQSHIYQNYQNIEEEIKEISWQLFNDDEMENPIANS